MTRKQKYSCRLIILLGIWFLPYLPLNAQYTLVFYNVENLFDCVDNPLTDDDAFTPEGDMKWTKRRYNQKLGNLFKAFAAIGKNEAPAIIGLAEVENRSVLEDLCEETPLSRVGYGIIHRDSPDPRGIDVALLYRKDLFTIIKQRFIPIEYRGRELESREILFVQLIHKSDSLNILVTHWPSRYGGAYETLPLRKAAAVTMQRILLEEGANLPALLMGDFNCSIGDEEMTYFIGLLNFGPVGSVHRLETDLTGSVYGTYKYQGNWQSLDHFFANDSFIKKFGQDIEEPVKVYAPQWLLGEDTFAGYKPFRTYLGSYYQGGVSDHLPLFLKVRLR